MAVSRVQRVIISAFVVATSLLVGSANGQFNVLPGFGLPDSGGTKVEFDAEFKATADGALGELSVSAQLGPGWHIYSTTQEAGGPTPTSFTLKTPGIEIAGPFVADHKPEKIESAAFKKKNGDPVTEEYFHDKVTWTAPIRVADGTDVKQLSIDGTVKGQICKDGQGCIPLFSLDPTFSAKYAGTIEKVSGVVPAKTGQSNPPNQEAAAKSNNSNLIPSIEGIMALTPTQLTSGPYKPDGLHATIEGIVTPSTVRPGDTLQLSLTITPDEGWHVYGYKPVPPATAGSRPTIVGIQTAWPISKPMRDGSPVPSKLEPGEFYFSDQVTWTFDIAVPEDAEPKAYPLSGIIGLQTCTEVSCDPPFAASFSARINVGNESSGSSGLTFGKSSYSTVAKLLTAAGGKEPPAAPPASDVASRGSESDVEKGEPFDLSQISVEPVEKPILMVLLFAFVGGFVLNFMPCVLPVIGLKVMSFVNQAGQSRRKTILLNVWYASGMMAVFLVLATLTSVASLGWGQQFNYDGFTIPMLAIVFVMGLSFLGVWEIPLPGFASSGAAADLAEKEGYSGAFFKGVITTILATPCSGPGLATALAYCANKPPAIVYLVFSFVGLGMALPYLVIGAFPKLIRFIPKPGPWMDTFKQILGFVLLATVVYMFTLISQKNVIPTIAFIFGLWAACWWIGRVPISAEFVSKAKSWILATGFAAVIGYFAYAPKSVNENELAWQPFSLAKLNELAEAQQTVLVDFTADW